MPRYVQSAGRWLAGWGGVIGMLALVGAACAPSAASIPVPALAGGAAPAAQSGPAPQSTSAPVKVKLRFGTLPILDAVPAKP